MFENESKNDLETNVLVTLRNLKSTRIIMGVVSALSIALGIGILLGELLLFEQEDYFFAVILLVFGVLIFLYVVFMKPFFRKVLKKTMQGKEGVNLYRFTEEGYEISTTLNDGTTGITQGNYFAFTQCKEFPEFWLLYLNKATYFIVEKSGMKTGTAEELKSFLLGKLGGKYKVLYKKK